MSIYLKIVCTSILVMIVSGFGVSFLDDTVDYFDEETGKWQSKCNIWCEIAYYTLLLAIGCLLVSLLLMIWMA